MKFLFRGIKLIFFIMVNCFCILLLVLNGFMYIMVFKGLLGVMKFCKFIFKFNWV